MSKARDLADVPAGGGDLNVDSGTLFVDASTNNIGIGTSSPEDSLHISQSVPIIKLTDTDTGVDHRIIGHGSTGGFNFVIDSNEVASDPYIGFQVSNSNAMRIDSDSNLLIGGTSNAFSPTNVPVQVTSPSSPAISIYRGSTSAGQDVFLLYSDYGGTFSQKFVIEANGDALSASGSYGQLSDANLKQDIVDANSQWDDIKALQFRNYRMKNLVETQGEDAPVYLGVIAQELEEAGMSGLVSETESGDKTVKMSILYTKSVKALQEAIAKIEALESTQADLIARIEALEAN